VIISKVTLADFEGPERLTTPAKNRYLKMGYSIVEEIFDADGNMHVTMVKHENIEIKDGENQQ